ncbi:hypothetical protein TrVE_jg10366 [Triparma verrucosa]|uniref:N-acetyltransferase domain-containing protein n=1 Tax=Triparma verrucosa TaxID=1606542 RepID=A0A9W7FHB9_9STRA|nr:hypothetical protein TrVE_jg10366 [Triparma verrucosa]
MSDSVQIVNPDDSQIEFVVQVQTDFLNSKHMCCLIPLGNCESVSEKTKQLNAVSKVSQTSVRSYAGLALDSSGRPLGYIQLKGHGMYCDMHKVKPGEVHVESLAVLPEARGKGVGRKLLQWGEDKAKADGCSLYSLAVLKGNPALRLYERFGFVKKEADCVEACMANMFVLCCFGRPYGCCDQHFGAYDMEKKIEPGAVEGVTTDRGGGA